MDLTLCDSDTNEIFSIVFNFLFLKRFFPTHLFCISFETKTSNASNLSIPSHYDLVARGSL